jgi:hypothetical protein
MRPMRPLCLPVRICGRPSGQPLGRPGPLFLTWLDFLSPWLDYGGMGVWCRFLCLLSSLLLALPPGWCCPGRLAPFRERPQPTEKREDATPHKGCCCCPKILQQRPTDSAPVPKPSNPIKSCCYEKPPMVLPDLGRQMLDLAVVPFAVVVQVPLLAGSECIEPAHVFVASSPPLHVLECVWLC